MPVTSTNCPSKTNKGTAKRMSELMPSSMRPTTTKIGVRVVTSKKEIVARQKAKAIGTPAIMPAPSSTMKKTRRFQLPIDFMKGVAP